ncbi:MAG: cytidine deaminase [Lachnospiraceae bacterium]|nr:cytidine deaminase [Lachnospiraceae bacterium]
MAENLVLSKELEEQLVSYAKKAMEKSYSPYSKFQVGAALLTADGNIYMGTNIENSSYGASNCAERTAVFKAVSEGHRNFYAIAIVGGLNGNITGICTPCGICRQVLNEFADENMIVLLGNQQGYKKFTLGELLPLSFSL